MNNVSAPATKNRTISIGSGVSIALGIWLIASPWIIGYASEVAMWNNVVVGTAVVIFAWSRLAERRLGGASSRMNLVLGVWLIVAPFVFVGITELQRWNCIIVGALVAILALVSGGAGVPRRTP